VKIIFRYLVLGLFSYSAQAELVVVMSANSTVNNLDRDRVSAIFLGKTATLPDGNPADPIEQPENSLLHQEFHRTVTEKSHAQLKAYWSKMIFSGKGNPPKEVASIAEAKKLIEENPSLIGYMDKSDVSNKLKVVFTP
jgi:ABC-type phosphate transport system substrate-binding protein